MTPEQRKSLILAGLTPPVVAPPNLHALGEMVDQIGASSDQTDHSELAGAGIILTLRSRFPEASLWVADGSEILRSDLELVTKGGPQGSPEWNDYFVGAYAAGDVGGLRELIRRAKHRDGTTAAVVAGTDAMGLLEAAAADSAAFAAVAAANGFRPGAVELGDHPPGSVTAFGVTGVAAAASDLTGLPSQTAATRAPQTAGSTPPPVRRPGGPPLPTSAYRAPAPAAAAPAAGPAALAVESGPAPQLGAAPIATADMGGGIVRLGDPNRPAARLAISEAIALGDSITASVRRLLLPAEGFTWIHDTMDPLRLASLVDLDTTRAANLPDFTGDGGGKLQAEVIQSLASSERRTVVYGCKLYSAAGTAETWGAFEDMSDAKFSVASRVRELLAAAPQ